MGYEARKTEHSGPKRGNGAYWGYKCEAKRESNRIRRENWKREIRDESARAESGLLTAPAAESPLNLCAVRRMECRPSHHRGYYQAGSELA
jgi:hypothetical protein